MAPWSTRYFLVLLGFLLVVTFDFGSTAVYETDDAIIVDAEEADHASRSARSVSETRQAEESPAEEEGVRVGRQIGGGWPPVLPVGPCFTSKGHLGRCTSFRQCYPYFKLPDLNNWETWILGTYDTCSYFNNNGRQQFGVCCTNPSFPSTPRPIQPPRPTPPAPLPPAVIVTPAPVQPVQPVQPSNPNPPPVVPASWPPTIPPLPTHPPDHTIPPLPTHPPSPGWPGLPQPQPTPPTQPQPLPPRPLPPTQAPIRPPPPTAPPVPVYPTRPPFTIPTRPPTQAPPVAVQPGPISDASCGSKNGLYQRSDNDTDALRIVGGVNADLGEWPWIAALFNGGRQFCGGSLIDSTHILSAAHCIAHMTSWDVSRLTVRLGDHNIQSNSETLHVEKKVKRLVRHRGFDSRTLYNDIAILTLDSPVTFSKNIKPICLPSGSALYAGQTATVVGWGSLRESGPQPGILQEVSIPIWTNSECRTKYGNAAPGGIVEHFVCAGRAGKDSCSGDSGGPLMVNEGRWTQVGVVSWGIGCGKGQYPGVYTRVTHFLPWIQKNLS